jgi:hypothetical protein
MKSKSSIRRATLALGFLGLVFAAVLLALHWDTVAAHYGAWRFQLGKNTVTIRPAKARGVSLTGQAFGMDSTRFELEDVLALLSDQSGYPVIYDPADGPVDARDSRLPTGKTWWPGAPQGGDQWSPTSFTVLCTAEMALSMLAKNGWKVIDQRFPRRAYILIRDQQDPAAREDSVQKLRVLNLGSEE